MSSKPLVVGCVLVVLSIAAAVMFTREIERPANLYVEAKAPSADGEAGIEMSESVQSESLQSPTVSEQGLDFKSVGPLPPVDAPLKDSIDDLAARADRGDIKAACRLASDLARCHFLPRVRQLVDEEITRSARAESGSTEESTSSMAAVRLGRFASTSETICAGIEEEMRRNAWRYLLKSANQGHVESMLRFAIRPPLIEESFAYDLEGWIAYRENAIPLLERAASQGSTLAVYHLFRAYAGMPMPAGVELVHKNPARAYAYGEALLRLSPPSQRGTIERRLEQLGQEVSMEQRVAAHSIISEIPLSRFRSRTEGESPLANSEFSEDSEECFAADSNHASR